MVVLSSSDTPIAGAKQPGHRGALKYIPDYTMLEPKWLRLGATTIIIITTTTTTTTITIVITIMNIIIIIIIIIIVIVIIAIKAKQWLSFEGGPLDRDYLTTTTS